MLVEEFGVRREVLKCKSKNCLQLTYTTLRLKLTFDFRIPSSTWNHNQLTWIQQHKKTLHFENQTYVFPFSSYDFIKLWTTISFIKTTTKVKLKHTERITHTYGPMACWCAFCRLCARFHFVGIRKEISRKSPMPIGSVVMRQYKKLRVKHLVRLFWK